MATSRAVLTDDERELGVALVDLGGGTTELVVFHEGKTRHLSTTPLGGSNITNDLMKGLTISFAEAERAKVQWGVASTQLADPRETVELPGPGPDTKHKVAREMLAHIIAQRLDEILEMVAQNLRKAVSRAGYTVDAFDHEPVATSRAVLTDDERELGVALVDLGGGTTELVVFHEGK
ncbi:MAG: cell division FtsA domain-containing protein, partial [Gemmatimonadota bacterium]